VGVVIAWVRGALVGLEQLQQLMLKDGRMWLPSRPGLGFTLSEQAQSWTRERFEVGQRS
jgi:L-alanine-DL-glutamate epimerase-like enolase superfamily enzyme